MSLEKPWEKPFEGLLQEISQHYRGEIYKADSRKPISSYDGVDSSYFLYPVFHGELPGQKFLIEISEFPASDISDLEAIDNVEYLRIFVIKPTLYRITVAHEDWLRRLEKKFHLDREFQTGNEEFDRRYYLRPQSEKDKQLLRDSQFQEMVRGIEPFSVLQVSKSGVRWSQMITDEKQLDFLVVDNYLKKTLELTTMISSK
jgi:hypothetical protein